MLKRDDLKDKDEEESIGIRSKKRADDDQDDDDEDQSRDSKDNEEDEEEDKKKMEESEESRSVEMIFSAGSGVIRHDENGQPYLEVLSLDPSAVDLSRLNSGSAPLLNSHERNGLSNILGVVEKAWIDPKTKQGVARVRFSKREDVDPIYRDVKDKIIVSTSVGYSVHEYEERTGEDGTPIRFVTRWTPQEISLVSIPADPDSKVRKRLLQTKMEMRIMPNENDILKKERKRSQEIRKAVSAANLDTSFADDLIERGYGIAEASQRIIGKLTEQQDSSPIQSIHPGNQDEYQTKVRGIENAILHRSAPDAFPLKQGRNMASGTFLDYAKLATRGYGGLSDQQFYFGSHQAPVDIFMRAFNSGTSDFPAILANVLNKLMRRSFESAPATWQTFCRKVFTSNLKPLQRPQLGEAPLMERKTEDGEFRRGSISETNQTFGLEEWGKILSISLRILLDDDMGAFSRIPELMGRAAQDNMSEEFYRLLATGPMLNDRGKIIPLFNKDQFRNVEDDGLELGVATLSKVRTALRQRKGQANRVLNLLPKYILAPSALETQFEQFLSQDLLAGQIQAVTQQMINPFAGKLQLIVEPRLDGYSENTFYCTPDIGQIDICEVAYLNGQESPMIISREGFSTSGIEWRINHWFGFGFLEHRSWHKVPNCKPYQPYTPKGK